MYGDYIIEATLGMFVTYVLPVLPVFLSWQIFVRLVFNRGESGIEQGKEFD